MAWEPPSPRVAELIRRGAHIALDAPAEWLDEIDRATLAASPEIREDPVLAASVTRTNRANLLHWAAANVRDPGRPVPGNLGAEPLTLARDLVRRGLDAAALDAYRVGQHVALRWWLKTAFELTSDAGELNEMLDVTSRSIGEFIDATLAGINAQMRSEREELTRGTHAERREAVALILEGAPITRRRAEARLGYALNQSHTAAVLWTDQSDSDTRALDRVVDALGQVTGTRPLNVIASAATRWVWIGGGKRLTVADLHSGLEQYPAVRVAVGPSATGVDGFRRSHLNALTTQRMLARLESRQRVVLFADVQLVALLTLDPEGADDFITAILGDFRHAPPELRSAVEIFINEQCNASRAAERLYTHRNTLKERLHRAEKLLPRPLEESTVHVAVALEALRWRGDVASDSRKASGPPSGRGRSTRSV
ncbi:MAG: PucR family transcriptional regulator [Mycobacterium sp.]